MDEVNTQLRAKLYLDRNPHDYDEILTRAIAKDNQFLVLEIAKRYGISNTSGLEKAPKSVDALMAYLIDCNCDIHENISDQDKISEIERSFGLKRKLPCNRNSMRRDQVYMDITRLNGDVTRIICGYLGSGDVLNLKLTCWSVCEFLLSLFNPEVITAYKLIRNAYHGTKHSEKLDITPWLLSRFGDILTTAAFIKSILPSININVSHLYVIAQFNGGPLSVFDIMMYIACNESDLVLSIIPISRKIANAALIAMLVFITPYYRKLQALMEIMNKEHLLPQDLFTAISRLPYCDKTFVSKIAHAWKSIGGSTKAQDFSECYICPMSDQTYGKCQICRQ